MFFFRKKAVWEGYLFSTSLPPSYVKLTNKKEKEGGGYFQTGNSNNNKIILQLKQLLIQFSPKFNLYFIFPLFRLKIKLLPNI